MSLVFECRFSPRGDRFLQVSSVSPHIHLLTALCFIRSSLYFSFTAMKIYFICVFHVKKKIKIAIAKTFF